MIRKLEHIGVMVNDMDESIRFYTDVMGMRLVDRVRLENGPELGFLSFAGSEDVQIELIGRGTDGKSDEGIVHHIAFTVTDLESEVERLRSHGVRIKEGFPKRILADRVNICFFYGPNGEQLELFERV